MNYTPKALRNVKENRMINRHMKAKAYLDYIRADYTVRNNGEHIIINMSDPAYRVDYWPSTGRWVRFANKKRGHGLTDLAKLMQRFLKQRLLNA